MSAVGPILIFLFLGCIVFALLRRRWNVKPPEELEDAEPCEFCGYDLRASPDRCPECGHEAPLMRTRRLRRLREEWPGNPINLRLPRPNETPCLLFTTFSGPLADLLRQHLECRGVVCQLSRAAGGIDPVNATPMIGAWRLVVWSEDAEQAVAIVKHLLPEQEFQEGLELSRAPVRDEQPGAEVRS